MMEICREYGYKYIFTHKGTRQRNLDESYELFKGSVEYTGVTRIGKEKGVAGYVNHVEDTVEKTETANIYEYRYEGDSGKMIKYQWLTNVEITKKNLDGIRGSGR